MRKIKIVDFCKECESLVEGETTIKDNGSYSFVCGVCGEWNFVNDDRQ